MIIAIHSVKLAQENYQQNAIVVLRIYYFLERLAIKPVVKATIYPSILKCAINAILLALPVSEILKHNALLVHKGLTFNNIHAIPFVLSVT